MLQFLRMMIWPSVPADSSLWLPRGFDDDDSWFEPPPHEVVHASRKTVEYRLSNGGRIPSQPSNFCGLRAFHASFRPVAEVDL